MSLRHVAYVLGTLLGIGILGVIVWAAFAVPSPGEVVSIETTPSRASAYIDGHFVGTTPVSVRNCPGGTHVLRLTRFGYAPVVCEMDVRRGPNALEFKLVELPGGTLTIKSSPSGADVAVDGEPRGQTPLTLKGLGTGGHPVRLTLVNYLDWVGVTEIEEDKTAELDVPLQSRTETHFLDAIKASPKDAGFHVELGHYYVLRGEWQKAENAFADALILVASEGESAQYMGRVFGEMEKVFTVQFKFDNVRRGQEAVVNALLRAVKACPKYVTYYAYTLHYATELGMTDRARDVLETGILAFPYNQDWALQAIHRRFGGEGSPDRFLARLDGLIKTNPKDFVAHYQRMVLLRQRGQTDEVIAEYETLVSLAHLPAVTSRLLSDLGGMWERKSNLEKAAEAYKKAVEAEPGKKEKAPIQYNLVRVLGRLKRGEEALAAWEKAVQYQDNAELACRWRLEWAQLCIDAKQTDRARSILNDVLNISKDDRTLNQAKELLRHVEKT
jgi:tetratricopeptide (TPR) repeat protein